MGIAQSSSDVRDLNWDYLSLLQFNKFCRILQVKMQKACCKEVMKVVNS